VDSCPGGLVDHCLCVARADSAPLIPTDQLLGGRTPDGVRGPLFIFRKIHLYGKTKKSTHDHQTTKPFRTHFRQSLYFDSELPYTLSPTYLIPNYLSTYPILNYPPTLYLKIQF